MASSEINQHLDRGCSEPASTRNKGLPSASRQISGTPSVTLAPIFSAKSKQLESSPIRADSVMKRSAEEQKSYGRPVKRTKTMNLQAAAPLADKLRPDTLAEFVGQHHLTGPDSSLTKMLASGSTESAIFWGPPGCGKTTLARLAAKQTDAVFKELSATVVGVNEVRVLLEEARSTLSLTGRKTILFLDEVHRFNKAQQDVFLPFVEQGLIQLLGATTENPSFKLTKALLSRCRVFVLERLTDDDIIAIVTNAIKRVSKNATANPSTWSSESIVISPPGSQASSSTLDTSDGSAFPHLTAKILTSIASLSAGDARTAISLLDLVIKSPPEIQEATLLACLRQSVSSSYDRTGDDHYDMISALHKSVRGSQGSAAMYWLARMLTAGEDPLYIARRMVVCASEDIGLADNHALPLATATFQACQTIGMPECRINLAHLVAYLAEAPKSTRAYEAYKSAEEAAKRDLTLPVPLAMRNAPTKLMDELGYGKGYLYNPQYAHPVHNTYLPAQIEGSTFLRSADDMTGKVWDEDSLREWEKEVNGGKAWQDGVVE